MTTDLAKSPGDEDREGPQVRPRQRPITALVPVFNGEHLLDECLDALQATFTEEPGLFLDVLVVDDRSDDASVEVARRRVQPSGGRIRLLALERNCGFAGAVNRGVESLLASDSAPEVLILVNQDCVVSRGWLAPLVQVLDDPAVAVAGARLLGADGLALQHAGASIEANGLTSHIGRGSRDPQAFRENRDVDYVCGALVAMRTSTWRRFGPFDEGYAPAYFEEVDFCTNARRAGMRVVYVAASEARHIEATTSGGAGDALFLRRYHRSRMRFVVRHLFGGMATVRWLFWELSWLLGRKRWSEARPALAAYTRLPALVRERARDRSSADDSRARDSRARDSRVAPLAAGVNAAESRT